jgi:hypothetical protein
MVADRCGGIGAGVCRRAARRSRSTAATIRSRCRAWVSFRSRPGRCFSTSAACENFGVSLLGSGVLDLIFEDGFD